MPEYQIVATHSLDFTTTLGDLTKLVAEHSKKGWVPLGGHQVIGLEAPGTRNAHFFASQSMIRELTAMALK